MSYAVGAYPAAPSVDPWQPEAEGEFLAGVAAIPGFRGLELPFLGTGLHAHDERWLLDQLTPGGEHVVTAIPATAMSVRRDATFGLASVDTEGRRRALDLASAMRDAVERVAQHQGRPAVVAVEIHSAPGGNARGPAGSADRFADSLTELIGWDWSGARVVVEHCDAAIGPHEPEKGYLPLSLEIEAIERLNAQADSGIGLAINWGRSVIEGRDPATAVDHVREAARAGLLAGIVFSGVSSAAEHPAGPWADAHLPPRPFEPTSLLDEAEIAATLAAAGDATAALGFVGVKLGARRADATPVARATGLRLAVEMVDRAMRT